MILPSDLQQTAEILRKSLVPRNDGNAPAVPAGLLDDLTARFGKNSHVIASREISRFRGIRSFVSTPAFGLAAAALVILTVALPPALRISGGTATAFRGGSAETAAPTSTSIVLIGAPRGIAESLGESGDFEKGSILTADNAPGSKVVVDFNESTITSVAADGQPLHTAGLPADRAELSAAIAEALSKL